MRRRGFPGLIAPASLKRPPSRWRRRRPERFSGVNCPGLIEAREVRRGSSKGYGPFSGVNCPGLIEAQFLNETATVGPKFSGVNCPGLIEASTTLFTIAASSSFSGVNCPGLIEAYASRLATTHRDYVFRG